MKQDKHIAEYKVVHGVPSSIDKQVNHLLDFEFELYGKPMVLTTSSNVDIMVQPMIRYRPTIF